MACARKICAAPTSPANSRALPYPNRRRSRSSMSFTTHTHWQTSTAMRANSKSPNSPRAAEPRAPASRRSTRRARRRSLRFHRAKRLDRQKSGLRKEAGQPGNGAAWREGDGSRRLGARDPGTDIEVAHASLPELQDLARRGRLLRIQRPRRSRGNGRPARRERDLQLLGRPGARERQPRLQPPAPWSPPPPAITAISTGRRPAKPRAPTIPPPRRTWSPSAAPG